jgi:hypothetical protein
MIETPLVINSDLRRASTFLTNVLFGNGCLALIDPAPYSTKSGIAGKKSYERPFFIIKVAKKKPRKMQGFIIFYVVLSRFKPKATFRYDQLYGS